MEVLYGLHPVEEAVRAGSKRLDSVLLARERRDERLERLAESCRAAGVRVRFEARDQMTRLAKTDAHQGALAMMKERAFLGIEDLLARPAGENGHRFFLALDGVEDPHNLGALLRTADGAGVDGVVLPERRSAPVSATVAKTSAGASEHVRIARVTNLVRALEQMKQANVWVLGLDERGSPEYSEFDYKTDCVLVLGREGAGLHDLVKKTCDHLLRIPMAGMVSSLNVSVAGAVVMYEAMRQRRQVAAPVEVARPAKPRRGLGILRRWFGKIAGLGVGLALAGGAGVAQDSGQAKDSQSEPKGTVLFSRDAATENGKTAATRQPDEDSLDVTDAERSSLTFTAYDLDVHLAPAVAGISVRAGLTVRNDGSAPLKRLVLQISSSLHWDGVSRRAADESMTGAVTAMKFAEHRVDTDADHTGAMEEAVVTLPEPLAAGAAMELTVLYSGTIAVSAERLERIGAPRDQAAAADWDAVAGPDENGITGGTALRGFGNVLWYPVSSPALFLGDGAKLFQAVGATKLREASASVKLRLAVEYVGDPPVAAFFCGRREPLKAIADNVGVPEAQAPGVATAEFTARTLGFRTPDLFTTNAAASDTGTADDKDMIAAVTSHSDALPAYGAAASSVTPLLKDWFGARPLEQLTILDHAGQPYEDDALLVRPVRAVNPDTLKAPLVHSLTHAWIRSNRAWVDEGLAEFASLLWTEQDEGRPAAIATMEQGAKLLALAEPEVPMDVASSSSSLSRTSSSSLNPASSSSLAAGDSQSDAQGQAQPAPSVSIEGASLAAATGEAFYRTKAAAVWWMLRGMVGDDALKQALKAYRDRPALDSEDDGVEQAVEAASHRDLRWFFNDWVYHDRGLPDLRIENVSPSPIQSRGGAQTGWLVAVVVHNDGYAEAEVPVTVKGRAGSATERLRVPARTTVSVRVVFAGTPEEVRVNDGGTPEMQTSEHVRVLSLTTR